MLLIFMLMYGAFPFKCLFYFFFRSPGCELPPTKQTDVAALITPFVKLFSPTQYFKERVTTGWGKLRNGELHNLYSSPDSIGGHAEAYLVEALSYKPEGCRFHS
jgi:hypothetical protein